MTILTNPQKTDLSITTSDTQQMVQPSDCFPLEHPISTTAVPQRNAGEEENMVKLRIVLVNGFGRLKRLSDMEVFFCTIVSVQCLVKLLANGIVWLKCMMVFLLRTHLLGVKITYRDKSIWIASCRWPEETVQKRWIVDCDISMKVNYSEVL